jgi:uncharacterized protein YlxW (UPF0749 family)
VTKVLAYCAFILVFVVGVCSQQSTQELRREIRAVNDRAGRDRFSVRQLQDQVQDLQNRVRELEATMPAPGTQKLTFWDWMEQHGRLSGEAAVPLPPR